RLRRGRARRPVPRARALLSDGRGRRGGPPEQLQGIGGACRRGSEMSDGTVVVAVRFPEMSLRGPRLLRRTARWLKAEIDAGCRPVVVVGTRSRREDRGLELAGAREIDRARAAAEDLAVASLALALSTLGVSARSLSARDIEL